MNTSLTDKCVEAALCHAGAASILPREARLTPSRRARGGTSCGQSRLYTTVVFLVLVLAAHAQGPGAAVSGISGVKQEAVEAVKPVPPLTLPPPPNSSSAQGVNKVEGIETIEGVKATGRAAPPPPPSATSAGGGSVGSGGSIRAVNGVTGINAAKLQNLEAALILKADGATPAGSGAERGGKGKAAAAALLSAPLEKPAPKISPKEDGRAGFQEFEKLQSRGS